MNRPLVVDLDGTLIRCDISVQSVLRWMVRHPVDALRQILTRPTRAAMKEAAAALCPLDVSALPYRSSVIEKVKEARDQGWRTVLATASVQAYADQVAEHLGIFDEVHGSRDGKTLKGDAKRDLLVERFGEKGFDYIGNSWADVPVWRAAEKRFIVGSSRAARRVENLVRLE